MSIKSTRTLKRSEALEMYYDLRQKLYGEEVRLTNYELGNKLDVMADEWAERNGTTCFDNYNVVNDEEYERIVQDWERY
jgi:hypothetical protein